MWIMKGEGIETLVDGSIEDGVPAPIEVEPLQMDALFRVIIHGTHFHLSGH